MMGKPVYLIRRTSRLKKDLRHLIKQGKDMQALEKVVDVLAEGKELDKKHLDHPLGGNWDGFRDCHIESDWVLIYKKDKKVLVLTLTRTGSRSELEL
jgi:mRNA interferase YafQ